MLLRDLQDALRKRFGLRAASSADTAASTGIAVGRNALASAQARQQDFAPLVPFEVVKTGVLAFVRGRDMGTTFDEQNELWLRSKTKSQVVSLPADGRTRRFLDYGALAWAGENLVLASWDTTANKLVAEAYRVLQRDQPIAPVLVAGPFEHDVQRQVAQAAIPAGARVGKAAMWAVSDPPHRANPASDPWFTVNTSTREFMGWDWEYDLPDGTPDNTWDVRCLRQNRFNLTYEYPPPDRQAQLWALRWEIDPSWTPSAPTTTPKFRVYRYLYTVSTGAPADWPIGTPDWTAIDSGNPTVTADHFPETLDYQNGGLAYDGTDLGWALRVVASCDSVFLYRYPCTFRHNVMGGGPAVSVPGHIYQRESVSARATGIRTRKNGATTYDDLPNGITSVLREDEEAFPSAGGTFRLAAPVTLVVKGLWDLSWALTHQSPLLTGYPPEGKTSEDYQALNYPWVDTAGNFWVFVQRQTAFTAYLVSQSLSILLALPVVSEDLAKRVRIFKAGDRLWVHKTLVDAGI